MVVSSRLILHVQGPIASGSSEMMHVSTNAHSLVRAQEIGQTTPYQQWNTHTRALGDAQIGHPTSYMQSNQNEDPWQYWQVYQSALGPHPQSVTLDPATHPQLQIPSSDASSGYSHFDYVDNSQAPQAQTLPQTGEKQNTLAPVGAALLGLLGGFGLFGKKRKKDEGDKM